jgi:hypothetical protein
VDEMPYEYQHIDFANKNTSPLLNNTSCRASRLPSSLMLHVIEWCMSSVGHCSNTSTRPSTDSVNGFIAESSFKRDVASAYLDQDTIRKKIRNNYDRLSFSARFVFRRLLFALDERRLCGICA